MTVIEQYLDTEVLINGFEWKVSNMSVVRSRYNKTNTVTMMATQDPTDNPDAVPVEGAEAIIRLGPRSSFVEGEGRSNTDTDGSLWRVFTGYVSNTFEMEEGLYEIDIVDSMVDLKKYEFSYSTETETRVSVIVRELVEQVNRFSDGTIDIDLGLNIELTASVDPRIGGGYFEIQQSSDQTNIDIPVDVDYTEKKASKVLDELAKMTNSNWWIDAFNVLHFGATETSIHKLDWVTDSSAGKQTPPYRSVRVIGDGISSEEGWESKDLISKNGIQVSSSVDDTVQDYGGYDRELLDAAGVDQEQVASSPTENELKPPTFTYKNKSIKTFEQARNIASKLIDELQEQQAGGNVTIVGRPMIDSLDIIEMPDRFATTTLGTTVKPAQYLVTKVEHRLTQSDGYVTKIECGGLAGRYSGPTFEYDDNGFLVLSNEEGQFEVEQ